jgi:hypothetical protein
MIEPPAFPPFWLIRGAVASVWLYEGLWCKLLRGEPRQLEVVAAAPFFGPRSVVRFLMALGALEVAIAFWVWSCAFPLLCASVQTVLLVGLNTAGVIWSRRLIHDPGGMVIKNVAFLVLAWVSASLALSA